MDKKRLLMLVEIAVFAGVGIILDTLTISMPQGGSVSFVMVPIVLMAIRWGLGAGMTTGLLIGLLQMMFVPKIYHWVQGLLDYGLAFTVVGLAAVVRKPLLEAARHSVKSRMILYITVGTVIGGLLRYAAHTIAGAVFFAEYAGDQNEWIYSIIYNGTYMIPAIILTAIVASLLFTAAPKLLKQG